MSIRSFSGMHDWHPSALIDTDADDGGDPDTIIWNIENSRCPRCERPLPELPEYPAGSRITACRSIPICGPCGSDEVDHLAPASYWPVDVDEIDARRSRFESFTQTGILELDSDTPVVLTEAGATPIMHPCNTGGWAQYGAVVDEDGAR